MSRGKPGISLDAAFAILERAAVARARCPISSGPDEGELKSRHFSALAKEGRILVEISSKNWRRITILTGLHKGKSTAPNPEKGSRVYQIVDTRGSVVNGKITDHGVASRCQPSLPRFLTREELA